MQQKKIKSIFTDSNSFLIIYTLFILIHLLLFSTSRIYPFLDNPNHLALATIYRFYESSANQFSQYFILDTFLKPNIVHLLFCGSTLFPSVEFGNKVFFCLYCVLLPVSVLLVIRKLRGNQLISLVSFLVLYNINVQYGFVGFIISIPFILFLFWVLLYHFEKQNIWCYGAIAGLLVLLFFMHVLAAIFALLIVLACCFFQYRKSLLNSFTQSIMTAPVILLIAWWWRYDTMQYQGSDITSFILSYYKEQYVDSLFNRLKFVIFDTFPLQEGFVNNALPLIFSLYVISLFFGILLAYRHKLQITLADRRHTPFYVFAACSIICFIFIPESLPGYSFLSERFSVFIFISLIIVISICAPQKLRPEVIGSIVVMCLVHYVFWFTYCADFEKENRFFNRDFFSFNAEGKKLAGLILDYRFKGRSVYENFPDYYIVWKQGIATTRTIDERSFPIRRKENATLLPPYITWVGKSNGYDGRYKDMDYLLVRGTRPETESLFLSDFKLFKASGSWALYENKQGAH